MTHETTTTDRTAFARWMLSVNKHMNRVAGIGPDDIEDYPYHDDYDDAVSAQAAALAALRNAGWTS